MALVVEFLKEGKVDAGALQQIAKNFFNVFMYSQYRCIILKTLLY